MVQFPPTEDDLRNPFRCASLIPESSAVPDSLFRPRKRRLEDDTGNGLYRENSLNTSNREKRQRLGHKVVSRSVDRDQPIISREDMGDQSSPGRYPSNKDQYNSYTASRPSFGHQPLGDQHSYQTSARNGFNPYGTPTSSSVVSIQRASQQPDPVSIPDSPQHVQAGQEQQEERAQSEPLSPKSESPELTTSINNPRPSSTMYMTNQNERKSDHQEVPGSPLHLDEVEGVLSTLPEENLQKLKTSEIMVADGQPAMESPERRATTSSKSLEKQMDVDTLQNSYRQSPTMRQNHRSRPASPEAKVINGVRQRDRSVVRSRTVARELESESDDEAPLGHDTSSRSEFVQELLKKPERRASDRVAGRPELQVNYAPRWTPLGVSDDEDLVAKRRKELNGTQIIAVEQCPSEEAHKDHKKVSRKKISKNTERSQSQKSQASTAGHHAEIESIRPAKSRASSSEWKEQRQGEKGQQKVFAANEQAADTDDQQYFGEIKENSRASYDESLLPGIEVDDLQSEPWVQAMLKNSDRQTETRKNQKAMQKKLLRNTNSNAGSTEPSEAPETILKHPTKEHLDARPDGQIAKGKANGNDRKPVKHKSQALPKEPGAALHETKQINSTSSGKQSSESEASNALNKKVKGMELDRSGAAKVPNLQGTSPKVSPKASADEDRVLQASTPKKRSTTPLYPSSSTKKPSALKYQSAHSSGNGHGLDTSSRYLAPSSAFRSSQVSKRRSVSWPDDIRTREEEQGDSTSSKASVGGTASKEVMSRYQNQSEHTPKQQEVSQIPDSTVQSPSTRNAQSTNLSDAAVELSSDSEKSMSPFVSGDEEEDSRQTSKSRENSNEMSSREGTSNSSNKGSESSRHTLRDILAQKTGTSQLSRGSRSPAKFIAGDIDQESSTGSERATSSVTESTTETETGPAAEVDPPHSDQSLRNPDPRANSDEQSASSVEYEVMETPRQLDKHTSSNQAKLGRRSEHSDVEANEQLLRESQASLPQSSQNHNKPTLQMGHSGSLKTTIPTDDLARRSTPTDGRSQENVTPSRFASFSTLVNKRKGTNGAGIMNGDMGKEKSPIDLDASETSGSETSEESSDGEPAQVDRRPGKRRNANASIKSLIESKFVC